ncbi:hypothetical protein [Prochlorococcus marinus]|uniref:hypothetical protein n=1 Tax=Prochlorococcus marinus TaxID=1219 RepID=UPI0022B5BB4D|nr:hypothetical protein [Prochlorococcus marinus]
MNHIFRKSIIITTLLSSCFAVDINYSRSVEIDCESPTWRKSDYCIKQRKNSSPSTPPITRIPRGNKINRIRPIILMPVVDKSGHKGMQGEAFKDFSTEILNQALRNTGVKTVPWFKVSKALEQEVYGLSNTTQSSSPYAFMIAPGMKQDLTSDLYITEMISAGEKLKADYIVRPVVLKLLTSSRVDTKKGRCLPVLGCSSDKTQLNVYGDVSIKIDIISIAEQDFLASRTFNGRSVDVTKERAVRIDNVVGSRVFSDESAFSCESDIKNKDICNESKLKIAIYDTIDKMVDFIDAKINYENP